jgi:hypothetical protein
MLTPELASRVVKNYLLPMFTNKRRLNNATTTSNQGGLKDFGILTSRLASVHSPKSPQPDQNSFVLSELQLNQDLYSKLQSTESQLLDTQEKLEATLQANRLLTK